MCNRVGCEANQNIFDVKCTVISIKILDKSDFTVGLESVPWCLLLIMVTAGQDKKTNKQVRFSHHPWSKVTLRCWKKEQIQSNFCPPLWPRQVYRWGWLHLCNDRVASSLQVWSLVVAAAAVVGERQGKPSLGGAVSAIYLPVSVPPPVYVYTPEDREIMMVKIYFIFFKLRNINKGHAIART